MVHRICQDPEVSLGNDVSIVDVFRGVLPFVGVSLALLVLMTYVPEIATFLPDSASLKE